MRSIVHVDIVVPLTDQDLPISYEMFETFEHFLAVLVGEFIRSHCTCVRRSSSAKLILTPCRVYAVVLDAKTAKAQMDDINSLVEAYFKKLAFLEFTHTRA